MPEFKDILLDQGEVLQATEELFREDVVKIFRKVDPKLFVSDPKQAFDIIIRSILILYKNKYEPDVIQRALKYAQDVLKNV